MHFSNNAENKKWHDSVGFAPFYINFLSKVKDFSKWNNNYQFLETGIVDYTVYGQKLDYMGSHYYGIWITILIFFFCSTFIIGSRFKSVIDTNWKFKRIVSVPLVWSEKFWYLKKNWSFTFLFVFFLETSRIYSSFSSSNVWGFLNYLGTYLEFSHSAG